jgi:hypothetical protein
MTGVMTTLLPNSLAAPAVDPSHGWLSSEAAVSGAGAIRSARAARVVVEALSSVVGVVAP